MEKIIKVACGEYGTFYLTDQNNCYSYYWDQPTQSTKMGVFQPNTIDASYGLHGGMTLDTSGNVYAFGDNTYGQAGNGTSNGTVLPSPTKITTDIKGNPFTNIAKIYTWFGTNFAIKTDGTLWIWGQDPLNFFNGSNTLYPTQMPLPAGATISKFVPQVPGWDGVGGMLMLDTRGNVWEWRSGSVNAVQVSLPGPATDIAAVNQKASFAIIGGYPYGWGTEPLYMCVTNGLSTKTPVALKDIWGVVAPIAQIAGNCNTCHFIDVNGDMWGFGDNAMGEVGIGTEINWLTYHAPYAWDWGKYELMVESIQHISPGIKFSKIWTDNSYVFYVYAQDTNGNIYSWGRNKALSLGNGLINYQDSIYPNMLDVTSPTIVTPLTTPTKILNVVVNNGIPSFTNYPNPTQSGTQSSPTQSGTTQSGTTQSSPTQSGTTQSISGYQGPQGNQGISGLAGTQGKSGPQGATGSQGKLGPQGAIGIGSQGRQGAVGVQGSSGFGSGSQGVQGSQGPIGISGQIGIQGFQGLQGSSGLAGVQGPIGQNGVQGLQGPSVKISTITIQYSDGSTQSFTSN